MVYTDAYGTNFGVVLIQDGTVVAYDPRPLKPFEVWYHVHNLELDVIIFTCKIWRHYLYGEKLELFMDNKSFKYRKINVT